jgi:hypothetical protein
MKQEIIDIEELAQDSHNFNKGNEQGQQLMERSFKELGAGRSILLDRNGNIIKGIRAPFTQGGGLRRGCGKMVGHLGKILAKKSVQVWPPTN